MKHLFRFLGQAAPDGVWVIDGDEHQHLAKVLRLAPGDGLEVMNGHGQVVRGSLLTVDNRVARVQVEAVLEDQKTAPRPLFHMGVGALKPGAVDDILPPLTELGVDVVDIFWQEGTAKFRVDEKSQRRWERVVLSASKQCKRAWLPQVRVWDSLDALLDAWSEMAAVYVLEPGRGESPYGARVPADGAYGVLVGGEKGFSSSEIDVLSNRNCHFINLGPFILRATTAVVCAASLLSLRRYTSVS